MRGMRDLVLFLGLFNLGSAVFILNEENLCSECSCSSQDVTCHFLSAKSRKILVAQLGIERDIQVFNLSGLPFSEIRISDVKARALSLFFFGSVIFKSGGGVFSNTTVVDSVDEVVFEPKSSSGLIQIRNVTKVIVSEKSFFHLKEFEAVNVTGSLILKEAAFKSRGAFLSPPNVKIHLEGIGDIPRIPHNAFSLCHSVTIMRSQVTLVEGNAFGGISIENISFVDSKIRRFERHSFPDMTLISSLNFITCEISSISEEAVTSAITSLLVQSTNVTYISQRAFRVLAAAKVRFISNYFPLSSDSLVFKTWSLVEISGNDFIFLESNAFVGISYPAVESSIFIFKNNRIRYANRRALSLFDFENTELIVEGNLFDEPCQCFFSAWLKNVIGTENEAELFLNESSCHLSQRDVACRSFPSNSPKITYYLSRACSLSSEDDDPCNDPWVLIREKFRPDTDQGLLLIILLSACVFTFVVSLYALVRWGIFKLFQSPISKDDEWNFTQIEPLKENPIAVDDIHHYDATEEPLDNVEGLKPKEKEDTASNRKSPTFYDEMLHLIKKKLDDPENYATVSDNACGNDYADPFDGKD